VAHQRNLDVQGSNLKSQLALLCREDRAAPGERSYYLNWIRRDLDPWRDIGGITRVRFPFPLSPPAVFHSSWPLRHACTPAGTDP
jgi:hypothetical protein